MTDQEPPQTDNRKEDVYKEPEMPDQDAIDAFKAELEKLEEQEIAKTKPKRKTTEKQIQAGKRNLERAREARKKKAEEKKKQQQYQFETEEEPVEYEVEYEEEPELVMKKRPVRRVALKQPERYPYDDSELKNELKELKKWMVYVAKETKKKSAPIPIPEPAKPAQPTKEDLLAQAYKNRIINY